MFTSVRHRLAALHTGRRSPIGGRFGVPTVAMVVLLPGLLSGCALSTSLLAARNTGTIVVEVIRMDSTIILSANGRSKQKTSRTITVTTMTQISGTGEQQRVFLNDYSLARPGYQQVIAGDSLQLYDPTDNTIYATTERASQAAAVRQMEKNAPKGSVSTSGTAIAYSPGGANDAPGRMSVFEQQLRAHLYELAGRTEINGRVALKLVPARRAVPLGRLQD